jgi:hypothetical protein
MIHQLTKSRRSDHATHRSPLDEGLGITIRFAHPDDAGRLRRLAALDSKRLPAGPLLVAEVSGELWAAVSVTSQPRAIADPFRHTAELVAMLQERAHRLTRSRQPAQAPQPLQMRPVYG